MLSKQTLSPFFVFYRTATLFLEIIYSLVTSAKRETILFLFGCSEVNSTWLITSELTNQRARKALFTCVVYTNDRYRKKHLSRICFSAWRGQLCSRADYVAPQNITNRLKTNSYYVEGLTKPVSFQGPCASSQVSLAVRIAKIKTQGHQRNAKLQMLTVVMTIPGINATRHCLNNTYTKEGDIQLCVEYNKHKFRLQ